MQFKEANNIAHDYDKIYIKVFNERKLARERAKKRLDGFEITLQKQWNHSLHLYLLRELLFLQKNILIAFHILVLFWVCARARSCMCVYDDGHQVAHWWIWLYKNHASLCLLAVTLSFVCYVSWHYQCTWWWVAFSMNLYTTKNMKLVDSRIRRSRFQQIGLKLRKLALYSRNFVVGWVTI